MLQSKINAWISDDGDHLLWSCCGKCPLQLGEKLEPRDWTSKSMLDMITYFRFVNMGASVAKLLQNTKECLI
uniref:Uncharacterized protein n=1 Tax=Romanomermis culicivorax TaxID=13658 RepID=A0A915I9H1_ROMCU